MKYLFLTIATLIIMSSCNQTNCSDIPEQFTSYHEAKRIIKSKQFAFEDKCMMTKSSWIDKAEYYSCDKIEGYMILETNRKTYIHKNLPIKIWNEFKKADSYGRFYNLNIKGRYQLLL